MSDVSGGWVCGVIGYGGKDCRCEDHDSHLAARWLYRQGCAPGLLDLEE
jgi:hypothetical protein